MAWNPVNDEVFVTALYVCLNVFVQGNVVSMWFAKIVNGALAICVDNYVCFWLASGVADCLPNGCKFCLYC